MASLATSLRRMREKQAAEAGAILLALSIAAMPFAYKNASFQEQFGSENSNHVSRVMPERYAAPTAHDREVANALYEKHIAESRFAKKAERGERSEEASIIGGIAMQLGVADIVVREKIATGLSIAVLTLLIGEARSGDPRAKVEALERLGQPVPKNLKRKAEQEEEKKNNLVPMVVVAPIALVLLAGWRTLVLLPTLIWNSLLGRGRSRRDLKTALAPKTQPHHMVVMPRPHPAPTAPMMSLDYI